MPPLLFIAKSKIFSYIKSTCSIIHFINYISHKIKCLITSFSKSNYIYFFVYIFILKCGCKSILAEYISRILQVLEASVIKNVSAQNLFFLICPNTLYLSFFAFSPIYSFLYHFTIFLVSKQYKTA